MSLTMTIPEINTGIPADERMEIAGALSRLLADTYTV